MGCVKHRAGLNHWRRDAICWRENCSVRREPKGAKNLALLRGDILALIPQKRFTPLNAAFDHCTECRAEALCLFTQNAPDQPIALTDRRPFAM